MMRKNSFIVMSGVVLSSLIFGSRAFAAVQPAKLAESAKIGELTRQAEEARYAKDIAEIKATLLQSQTSWFEILTSSMIGLFGILITVVIIYFAVRFGKEAVAEAKLAATQGLERERNSIQTLLEQAKAAVAEIHVTHETAQELLKDMTPGQAPTDPGTVRQIADLAAEALAKPRRERTVEDYRALVTNAAVNENWDEMERLSSAMAFFWEDDLNDQSTAFALFNRAYALSKLLKFEEAEKVYSDLIARFYLRDSSELRKYVEMALNNSGIALSAQARKQKGDAADTLYAQAGAKFAAALAIKREKHEALFNWGNALTDQANTKQGDVAQALFSQAGEKYAAALEIKPDDHDALNNWGAVLADQAMEIKGDAADALFAQAGEKYAAALAIKPDKHEALSNWGALLSNRARRSKGKAFSSLFEQACDKYDAALKINPDSHEALFNWALAISAQATQKDGVPADALVAKAGEKYAAALAIKPDKHEALSNWGLMLLDQARTKQGDAADAIYAQAREKLLAADAILPGSCSYNLACLAGLQGDVASAAEFLERSKADGGDWPGCEQVLTDTDFASVRDTDEFKKALAAVGCA